MTKAALYSKHVSKLQKKYLTTYITFPWWHKQFINVKEEINFDLYKVRWSNLVFDLSPNQDKERRAANERELCREVTTAPHEAELLLRHLEVHQRKQVRSTIVYYFYFSFLIRQKMKEEKPRQADQRCLFSFRAQLKDPILPVIMHNHSRRMHVHTDVLLCLYFKQVDFIQIGRWQLK